MRVKWHTAAACTHTNDNTPSSSLQDITCKFVYVMHLPYTSNITLFLDPKKHRTVSAKHWPPSAFSQTKADSPVIREEEGKITTDMLIALDSQWHPNLTSGAPRCTHWYTACHRCLVLLNSYFSTVLLSSLQLVLPLLPLSLLPTEHSLLPLPLSLYLQCFPSRLNNFEYYHGKKGRKNIKRDMVKKKRKKNQNKNDHRCTRVGNGVVTPFILVACVI